MVKRYDGVFGWMQSLQAGAGTLPDECGLHPRSHIGRCIRVPGRGGAEQVGECAGHVPGAAAHGIHHPGR